jgi:hypothetical protein
MASITDLRAINTPQKSYQWEVAIQGLSTGSLSALTVYAKSVAIPASSVDQVRIPFKASNVYYAGRDNAPHTVTIAFWDDENQTVRNYFQNWFDILMHNPITGGQAPKNLYTADITLTLMDSSGNNTTAKIKLSAAFPTDLQDINLSYDSSEPLELSVQFVYDTKTIVS